MLPTKFRFNWLGSFRGEDFYIPTNQKQELPVVAMIVNRLGRNEQSSWNLVGSIYGRSSLKSAHFVMIHYQTWPSTGNSCFWFTNFKKSPPLKPLGQINRNMTGSIYGMSSMKIAQVSVHLTDGFQRRGLKCEKLTDDRQQTTDNKRCQKSTLPLARWAKKNIKMWIPTSCNV
jgi:hypothetical protein